MESGIPAKVRKTDFHCEVCGNVFASNFSLQRHKKAKHVVRESTTTGHECDICGKILTTAAILERHLLHVHIGEKKFSCPICQSKFSRKEHLLSHVKTHAKKNKSPPVKSPNPSQLVSQIMTDPNPDDQFPEIVNSSSLFPADSQNRPDGIQSVIEGTSSQRVDNVLNLFESDGAQASSKQAESQCGKIDEEIPLKDPINLDASFAVPYGGEEAIALFKKFWHLIRTNTSRIGLRYVYNFQLPICVQTSKLKELLLRVHHEQNSIYKVHFAFGLLLRHKSKQTLSYFYPEKNFAVPEIPTLVTNIGDLYRVIETLESFDPYEYAVNHRPDTVQELHCLTNISFYIYPLHKSTIGNPGAIVQQEVEEGADEDQQSSSLETEREIKEYIKNSKCLFSFNKNPNGGEYKDNLCFFRALTSQILQRRCVTKRDLKVTYSKWVDWSRQNGRRIYPIEQFPGIELPNDISDLEDCFEVNIQIYTLTKKWSDQAEDYGDIYEYLALQEINPGEEIPIDNDDAQNEIMAQQVVRSMKCYATDLHLNLNFCHFSRITNIQRYAKFWRCEICDRVQNRRNNYMNHVRTRTGSIKEKFPGGGYGNKLSIFDKLSDEGILVASENQFYPFRIVFDFEARFEELPSDKTDGLVFEKKLLPVSVSVLSNVPGIDSVKCFVEENPTTLIAKFYDYLELISKTASDLMMTKYEEVTQELEVMVNSVNNMRDDLKQTRNLKDRAEEVERLEKKLSESSYWDDLLTNWKKWLTIIPVLGYNSSRFDLQLIQKYLIPHIMKSEVEIKSIKRGSGYLMLSTDKLMFLDVLNFLGQGTSYSAWLAGFGVKETKGFWPYEWLTDFRKLSQTYLPDKDAFYSTLKGEGISKEDYSSLQKIWIDNKFQDMRDVLIWYNNKDVEPFMTALNKMWNIFKEMGIDMLKSGCISLPGLAHLRMFKDLKPDVVFQVFNEKNKDLFDLIRSNIVGGPSIIFKRLLMAGEGRIKGTGPTPASVMGKDANGLYLWATAEETATGIAKKWTPIDGIPGHKIPAVVGMRDEGTWKQELKENMNIIFKKEHTAQGHEELIAVNVVFQRLQEKYPDKKLTLRHKYNGKQKVFRVGKQRLPVDGWVPELRLIIQYHGCFFHGHDCRLTTNMDPRLKSLREESTIKVRDQLRTTGCTIAELRQCDFYDLQKDPKIKNYTQTFETRSKWRKEATMGQLIDDIKSGAFFGLVQVDIQVPFWDLELRAKMQEFPPIFKNTEIGIEDIGDHMADFANQNDLLKKPRRTLIGSYYAEEMLFATPLLKWLLEHGLQITRIYCALEYVPRRPFAHLPQEVADHRRRADRDPGLAAYGQLFKLMGNSYYGRCLTDRTRFRNIAYQNRKDASQSICSPLFRKLEGINEDCYEVQTANGTILQDLPITIAFFVYAHAKLRMLQFYYDFLQRVLPYDHFELLEVDTDSFYMALPAQNIQESVPEDLLPLFHDLKKLFLVCTEYDKKTVGLFKTEWVGSQMICLAPKTYMAFTKDEATGEINDVKLSTKGIGKRSNDVSEKDFIHVLETKQSVKGVNRGFRLNGRELCQYIQTKIGLSYLYIKRIVADDGIHTSPLPN